MASRNSGRNRVHPWRPTDCRNIGEPCGSSHTADPHPISVAARADGLLRCCAERGIHSTGARSESAILHQRLFNRWAGSIARPAVSATLQRIIIAGRFLFQQASIDPLMPMPTLVTAQ